MPAFSVRARVKGYIAEGRARADRYMAARPHRSFRPTPRMKYKRGKRVMNVWPLVKSTFVFLWQEKKVFGGLMLLFALASFVFVGGVSQLSYVDLRKSTQSLFSGNLGEIGSVFTLFSSAVTGGLNPSVGQLQQFLGAFITFVFWLVFVYALRRRMADKHVTIREALYNAGAPIISSALVLVMFVIQLVPAALGIFAGGLALAGLWFSGGAASLLTCAAGALLCLLSLYWITSSAMAMVIVTLPGMYPWAALSAASELVMTQRWRLVLRVLALALTIFVVWAAVLIPTLLLEGWLKFDWLPLIPIIVQLLGAFTLAYGSAYIYRMYRSML